MLDDLALQAELLCPREQRLIEGHADHLAGLAPSSVSSVSSSRSGLEGTLLGICKGRIDLVPFIALFIPTADHHARAAAVSLKDVLDRRTRCLQRRLGSGVCEQQPPSCVTTTSGGTATSASRATSGPRRRPSRWPSALGASAASSSAFVANLDHLTCRSDPFAGNHRSMLCGGPHGRSDPAARMARTRCPRPPP